MSISATDPEEAKKDELAANLMRKALALTITTRDSKTRLKAATDRLTREITNLSGVTADYKEDVRSRATKMIERIFAKDERERRASTKRRRERGGNIALLIVILIGLLVAFMLGKW